MRINPERESSGVAGNREVKGPPAQPARIGRDQLAISASEKLDSHLQQTPPVRSDKVARAKTLLADPSYPPTAIVRALSEHLAKKMH